MSNSSLSSVPFQFSHFASIANRPNFKPELLSINPKPADLVPPSDNDGSSNEISDSSERRNVELPEEKVMVLSCESSAWGGNCNVYLVGTSHVSEESVREVEAVISYLKPQVVFLESCQDRLPALTRKSLKVPTTMEMVEMWKENHGFFTIFFTWVYYEMGSWLGVVPGSEFRAASEEAKKYGGKITLLRIRGKVSLWEGTKLLSARSLLRTSEHFKKMLKDLDDVEKEDHLTQEMSKKFPSLMKTIVDERDQVMSWARLVVAVVGRGHLNGIRKYWKQPVSIDDLMTTPLQKFAVTTGKTLASLGIATAGVDIVSGIYIASKI